MKTMLFSFVVLLSSFSFAQATLTPTVGDSVEYRRIWKFADGSSKIESVVQSLQSFDSNLRNYTVSICQDQFCQSFQASEAVVINSMYSSIRVSECLKQRGDIQRIQVRAGSFETCHGFVSSTEVWDANVPFGLVKSIMKIADGGTATDELVKIEKH